MALWTPAEITTALWLDADDASSITEVSGAVSAWADKSGNGRHVSQATNSLQPTYDAVSGSVDYVYGSKFLGGTIHGSVVSNDFVVALDLDYVSNVGGTGGLYVSFIQIATAGTDGVFWHYERTNAQSLEFYTNGSLTTAGTNSLLNSNLGQMILTLQKIGNEYYFYRDGNLLGSSTTTPPILTTDQSLRIGKGTFNNARCPTAKFHEVIICDNERQKLEGYLAWKRGLQANLPSDHPYKNAAPETTPTGDISEGNLVEISQQVTDATDIIADGDLITISQSVNLTTSGNVVSFSQTVGRFGSGNLISLEQAIDLRLVGRGGLVSLSQTINATTTAGVGNLTRIAQLVSDATQPILAQSFDLELIVGDLIIPRNQIHGSISITRSESSAALMNVTLIPPKGMQNITQYQGKNIILNYIADGQSTRLYTGKVDIPEVDIMMQTITLRCTDNRAEQNNALDPVFVQGIGCYSEAVFGEAKDQNDEIEKRLRTAQASLDYDANGLVTFTDWTPKTTADFVFDDASIYRRTPQVEVLSRGRVINKVNLDITYRWPLLRHRERSYVWNYPFNANSWCGFLVDNIGLCPVEAPRRAAEGAGWPITNYQTEPLPESKWYRCTGNGVTNRPIGWQTSKRTCNFEQKLDENDQPVKDSEGKDVLVATDCTVIDSRNAFATRASWTASNRWVQTIEQTTSYTITAPQSIAQYGVVERDDRVGVESEFDTRPWEEYRTHQKVPEVFTQTPNGDWVKFENQEGINNLVSAINCIRNKAVADILGSHRQNYVTLQLPIHPQIDLRHTVETTAGKIRCKGKVYQIQHTIDVGDKFAETQIQIALSRVEGSAVDSLPDVAFGSVVDHPATVNSFVLRNYIGGRAPRSVIGGDIPNYSDVTIRPGTPSGLPTDAQGFVTNYKYDRTRPLYTEAFIVDTPAIEDAARDKREVEFDQNATVAIRNDLLEVVFDE